MDLKDENVGFIGAGNMATALISGLLKTGALKPENIWVSAPTMNHLTKIKGLGCNVTHCNIEVVQNCKTAILCVKPFKVREAVGGLTSSPNLISNRLLISVVSGITIKTLENALPGMRIVRAMPNLACEVLTGVFVYALGSRLSECEIVPQLFGHLGICEQISEDLIDTVCGLCGSGPAYVFTVIQAMSDGAVKMGLPRNLATRLAAQTTMGASKMVLQTGKHPGVLSDEVCSPSGTTIFGLHALEKAGVRSAFMDAVEAATRRAKEQNIQSTNP